MSADIQTLSAAVLAGDIHGAETCLTRGVSANSLWGDLPLVTHAALTLNVPMFRLLRSYGALIPRSFLRNLISWELGDWRIVSDEDENNLVAILEDVRLTEAWLSDDERALLAEHLEGYNLDKVRAVLLPDIGG